MKRLPAKILPPNGCEFSRGNRGSVVRFATGMKRTVSTIFPATLRVVIVCPRMVSSRGFCHIGLMTRAALESEIPAEMSVSSYFQWLAGKRVGKWECVEEPRGIRPLNVDVVVNVRMAEAFHRSLVVT